MADRSWRHGLHQAIEVKEAVKVTSDKENLARLSFQRFFRQYPIMAGMTGTAWESAAEMWQIYQRPIVRIPTNRPCIRIHLPIRMFDTADESVDTGPWVTEEADEQPELASDDFDLSSWEVSWTGDAPTDVDEVPTGDSP